MRSIIAAVLLPLLAASSFGAPRTGPPVDAERSLAVVRKRLEQGDRIVARGRKIRKESKRVRVLVLSKNHYRRARIVAGRALPYATGAVRYRLAQAERKATQSLVDVLNDEAEFYFGRSSTGQAKKRNQEALMLRPNDRRALALARDIRNEANSGFVFGGRGFGRRR